jgi:hypothetical protein
VLAAVEIVSDDDAAVPPSTDAGLKAQVAPLGNPEQASVTVWLNPKFEIRPMVALEEFPAVTVGGENVVAESEKLAGLVFSNTPMPLKPGVVSAGTEKTMSGRPSLFMSAISGVCIAPFFVM